MACAACVTEGDRVRLRWTADAPTRPTCTATTSSRRSPRPGDGASVRRLRDRQVPARGPRLGSFRSRGAASGPRGLSALRRRAVSRARLGTAIVGGLAGALVLGQAGPACSHAFGQRYDLPVPLGLYLAGAGAAVAFSFVDRDLLRDIAWTRAYPRLNLLRYPLGRLMAHPLLLFVLKLAAVLLFALVVAAGFLRQPAAFAQHRPDRGVGRLVGGARRRLGFRRRSVGADQPLAHPRSRGRRRSTAASAAARCPSACVTPRRSVYGPLSCCSWCSRGWSWRLGRRCPPTSPGWRSAIR